MPRERWDARCRIKRRATSFRYVSVKPPSTVITLPVM
ncbi:hypothetical protein BJ122_108141 [Rhodopseudomonas faecalis]|uniref:Uncharacterized protein n=1 Tax=Rhodopseudomonas faecalis TaxID=99655 RepID=A0A318TE94_9BRAD|nr:hypothetical protein BJ122_108141 [Rhodopseudomonas faecalis]